MASSRAVIAVSVTGAFASFESRAPTRDVRSSNAVALTCGAAGGDCTSGQPRNEPTASTTAAATRPDNGATSQGDARRGPLAGDACFGDSGLVSDSGRDASAPSVCDAFSEAFSETWVASRSIVGGSRLALPASGAGAASCSTSSAMPAVPWLVPWLMGHQYIPES